MRFSRRLTFAANRSLELIVEGFNLANQLILPHPAGEDGNERHSGWQSLSNWAPSRLTALSERAAARNNELPQ